MSSRNRIPSALEAYLRLPPEASLTLLTGSLGCSVHWLTVRFIASTLQHLDVLDLAPPQVAGHEEPAVILVSWMRDAAFWKAELRRAVGVDTTKMAEAGRFGFVDCFTTLSSHTPTTVLEGLEKDITDAIRKLANGSKEKALTLVLDAPDVLLAFSLATAQELSTLVLKLRSQAYCTIATCSADLPHIGAAMAEPAEKISPLEAETAAFVVQQAHAARLVMSARELETGAAKDVSGVLRITRGGAAAYDGFVDDEVYEEAEEMEALYLVQRDGNAKVLKRGNAG